MKHDMRSILLAGLNIKTLNMWSRRRRRSNLNRYPKHFGCRYNFENQTHAPEREGWLKVDVVTSANAY
jgi:hypothetical protein